MLEASARYSNGGGVGTSAKALTRTGRAVGRGVKAFALGCPWPCTRVSRVLLERGSLFCAGVRPFAVRAKAFTLGVEPLVVGVSAVVHDPNASALRSKGMAPGYRTLSRCGHGLGRSCKRSRSVNEARFSARKARDARIPWASPRDPIGLLAMGAAWPFDPPRLSSKRTSIPCVWSPRPVKGTGSFLDPSTLARRVSLRVHEVEAWRGRTERLADAVTGFAVHVRAVGPRSRLIT